MRPLRSPVVVRSLAFLFAAYLRFVFRTLRWTREGQETAESVWKPRGTPGTGAILCFWHARIPLSPVSWPQSETRQDMRALISRSADGEFIAQSMERIGFPSIRGSSATKGTPKRVPIETPQYPTGQAAPMISSCWAASSVAFHSATAL